MAKKKSPAAVDPTPTPPVTGATETAPTAEAQSIGADTSSAKPGSSGDSGPVSKPGKPTRKKPGDPKAAPASATSPGTDALPDTVENTNLAGASAATLSSLAKARGTVSNRKATPADPVSDRETDADPEDAADAGAIPEQATDEVPAAKPAEPALGPLPPLDAGKGPDRIWHGHVAVVGRSAAGYLTAMALAQLDVKTVLVDGPPDDDMGLSGPLIWTSRAGRDVIESLAGALPWITPVPLTFLQADPARTDNRTTKPPQSPEIFMIGDAALRNALMKQAMGRGVHITTPAATKLSLRDSCIELIQNERKLVRAGLLVYAADAVGKPLLEAARLRTPLQGVSPGWTVHHLTSRTKGKPAFCVITSWRGSSTLGAFWTDGADGVLCLPEAQPAQQPVLDTLLKWLSDAGVLPRGMAPVAAAPQRRRFRPASSLEFDQHFGKRCLLVGQGGGFSSALSGESLFIASQVAHLAAETCNIALRSRQPQDLLSRFDVRWRTSLGESMRMPNADPHFILPVIFTNPQIAQRIANAYVSGGSI